MARSQARDLTGMLTSIGDTAGKFGDTGQQYLGTLRRSFAPETDMNDSASLLRYADWARRNGYDEEARQYLALGYKRKAVEGEKEYTTYVASNTEKLRGFNTSIANLEQAVANGDPNAQVALDRVTSARDQHISAMNKYGKDSDYGKGNEGGLAQRAYAAELVAAEKAALNRDKLVLEIGNMRAELADFISEGEPIDLSLVPPNLRASYEQGLARAAEDPRGDTAAIRDLNKIFRKPSEEYIAGLAKGDSGTKVLLAEAKKGLRDLDSDLADFFADTDNTAVLDLVMQAAEDELLKDPAYRLMSKAEQEVEAREVFTRLLRAESEEFDREYKGAYRTAQGGQNSADQTTEDLERRYDAGMEPGGDEYKAAVARARQAKGENFDQQAFDASWDRRFYNPFGATVMPAPVY
jgi:hypothetical protein